jgi:virulence factor
MIKLGIVDFDTSHVVAFTQRLNHIGVSEDQWVDGAQVIMGSPGVSLIAPETTPGYTEQLRSYGIKIVDDPTEMIGQIDGVLIESLEGGTHYERAKPFIEAGIPTYIDKPFTCSLQHAKAIAELAEAKKVPIFSSSSLRYGLEVQEILDKKSEFGSVIGVQAYSPGSLHPRNPGLFHYGIHGVEPMFALMGPGCDSVWAVSTEGADAIIGLWKDGRTASVRATRAGAHSYGFTAFCEKRVIQASINAGVIYRELLKQIVKMFTTGESPLDIRETLEIIAFIEAVMTSSKHDGAKTPLENF